MAGNIASTVEQYLESLPEERAKVVSTIRELILKNLPTGYLETVNWGMISYEIPSARYPDTYNKQPLALAGLAAQKNAYSLYVNCVEDYDTRRQWFQERFDLAGLKLNMGKACIRFKKLQDLPLDAIAEYIRSIPPETLISTYESSRANR